jgi:hypothetical protein
LLDGDVDLAAVGPGALRRLSLERLPEIDLPKLLLQQLDLLFRPATGLQRINKAKCHVTYIHGAVKLN